MKRKIIGIIIAMSILNLCGCQETPDQEVVIGKDAEQFESMVQKENEDSTDAESSTQVDPVREYKYEESFTGNSENILIEINSRVSEIAGNIPVYKTRPYQPTADDAKQWAKYFFDDAIVYDVAVEKSKSEIAEHILRIKRGLDEDYLQEEYGDNQEMLEYVRKYGQEQLSFYEAKYLEAPETVTRQKATWEFHPLSYYDYDSELSTDSDSVNFFKTQALKVEADIEGGTAQIWVTNRNEQDFQRHNIQFNMNDNSAYEIGKMECSKDDAEKIVKDALEKLNLNEWIIDDCERVEREEGISYFLISCAKNYNGVSTIVLPQLSTVKGEGDYAARYYYETLEFHVSNDQICYASWEGCTEITDTVNDNVAALAFEDALDRFKTQIDVQYTENMLGEMAEESHQYEIYVYKITEGLVRIKVPNSEYEYYMVPAWCFYGNINGQKFDSEDHNECPLITINAIDGSIINTELGY